MTDDLSTGTRERILAGAVRIVGDEGGGALTVRRVAAAAGCSTIGVYTHFHDKAGLLEAVVLDGFERFEAALAASDGIPDGRSRLVSSALAYRRWALENRTRYLIMFTPFVVGFSPRPAVTARTAEAFAAHRARVEHAITEGALRPCDPDELARHLWAVVHGHVLLDLMIDTSADDESADGVFRRALDSLFDGIA